MKPKLRLAGLVLAGALPLGALSAEPLRSPAGSLAAHNAIGAPPGTPLPREEPAPLFEKLDSNHDSFLTKDEARRSAEVMARFKELDIDRDGRISAAEFKKVMQPKL